MSTPQDIIWSKFSEKKYEEIISCIEENKELVNVADKRGGSLLQWTLTGSKPGDERQKLLEFIVTHPELQWSHKDQEGDTNVSALIASTRSDLLSLVVKNSQVLVSENKLAYELAKKLLTDVEKLLQNTMKRNPTSKMCPKYQERIQNFGEVIALLRDATILHALKTDDASLLTKLDLAGGKPKEKMGKHGGEKELNMLLTMSNINIKAWFRGRSGTALKNITNVPSSLFNTVQLLKNLEAQKISLAQKYSKDRTDLDIQKVELMGNFLDEAKDIINPTKK